MTNSLIDTHCHLDLFENIQHNKKAEDETLIKTITVTNAPSFFGPNKMLFKECKNIRVALGLHPELISSYGREISDFSNLIGQTRYIGEIGLDGSTRFKSSFIDQVKVFGQLLKNVNECSGKVLTIHSRNAAKEVVGLLDSQKVLSKNKVILHWYTGEKDSLKRAVDMGAYISINHKMLQSGNGLNILKVVPIKQILTETDAPFTFDSKVKTRLQSLNSCFSTMCDTLNIPRQEAVHTVYGNFKKLLND